MKPLVLNDWSMPGYLYEYLRRGLANCSYVIEQLMTELHPPRSQPRLIFSMLKKGFLVCNTIIGVYGGEALV